MLVAQSTISRAYLDEGNARSGVEVYEEKIDKAIKTIEETGNNKIIILHCVSIYPPENNQVNLKRISTLQQMYPDYPIGFSDHSLGSTLPVASIALGAAVIEKHFTFDKDMEGWDHKVSADEQELIDICAGAKKVYESMGTSRVSAVEDSKRRTEFKRSLIITKDMKKGEIREISSHFLKKKFKTHFYL